MTLVPTAVASVTQTFTMGGTVGQMYVLTLRVRGVVDLNRYTGSTAVQPYVVQGGTVELAAGTQALLSIAGGQSYRLNATPFAVIPTHNVALDYLLDVVIPGGAVVTLTLTNVDLMQYKGDADDALIDQAPVGAYDGIWMQVDSGPSEPLVTYSVDTGAGTRGWLWSAFAENVYGVRAED